MRKPITKEGFERLSAELENLKTVERPNIVRAIGEARKHGDLSENAEYHSAKEKQGYIEARIKLLESVLSTSDIFDPSTVESEGRCLFGCYAELRNEEGAVFNYRLVSEFEADAGQGFISSISPIGKALLGKSAGDTVVVTTPAGEVEYEILAVRHR